MNLDNEFVPFGKIVDFLRQNHDESLLDRKTASVLSAVITDKCTPGDLARSNIETYLVAYFFEGRAKLESFKYLFSAIKSFAFREICNELKTRRYNVKENKRQIKMALHLISMHFTPKF